MFISDWAWKAQYRIKTLSPKTYPTPHPMPSTHLPFELKPRPITKALMLILDLNSISS